jgi:hypothetical protein
LDLIGSIDIESEYYKIAYKFIRNVSLDVEDLRWNNYFLRPKTEIILYFFMRIISGQFKGRRISPPKVYSSSHHRYVQEALFNVLNNHFSFEGLKY